MPSNGSIFRELLMDQGMSWETTIFGMWAFLGTFVVLMGILIYDWWTGSKGGAK